MWHQVELTIYPLTKVIIPSVILILIIPKLVYSRLCWDDLYFFPFSKREVEKFCIVIRCYS